MTSELYEWRFTMDDGRGGNIGWENLIDEYEYNAGHGDVRIVREPVLADAERLAARIRACDFMRYTRFKIWWNVGSPCNVLCVGNRVYAFGQYGCAIFEKTKRA